MKTTTNKEQESFLVSEREGLNWSLIIGLGMSATISCLSLWLGYQLVCARQPWFAGLYLVFALIALIFMPEPEQD